MYAYVITYPLNLMSDYLTEAVQNNAYTLTLVACKLPTLQIVLYNLKSID